MNSDDLYLGIRGHVVCVSKRNGSEKWRTKLRSGSITNVYAMENEIYACTNGHLYALNPTSGSILWQNPLKGLGYGVATMGIA